MKVWWDAIIDVGRFLGYTMKPSKLWLIVKEPYITLAYTVFQNAGIQVTTEGRFHLGAGIESSQIEFVESKRRNWWPKLMCYLALPLPNHMQLKALLRSR